ncbi:MAG TPA: glycosyltransferase family 1 protein [Firmicutes bacterium]|nr:glycosyltransferase family 1 protein [Bacillota bacterium]
MKILYIITKLELGGAQKVCLTLARHLSLEHDVYVMTGPGGDLNSEAERFLGKHLIINPWLRRRVSPYHDMRAYFFMKGFIRRHAFDIVHTHSSKAGILGRLAAFRARTPKIFHTVHGFPFNDFRSFAANLVYLTLERLCAPLTRRLICVTAEDVALGRAKRVGRPEQYIIIRAAADIEAFHSYQPDETLFRREWDIPLDAPLVVQVSCLKPQKNPVDFVNIAQKVNEKRNKKAVFILVGDGILRYAVEERVRMVKAAPYIRLAGWQKDVRPFLAAADIVTLTSLWEGLPIAIIEAFALHKCIVATAINGNREVIRHGENGYLYEPRDTDAGARFVRELLDHPEERKAMGKAGYERILREFSIEKMVEDTKKLYFSI